ncbi:DUF362 domain-containing protein [Candidatus Bathyarchaeota archaeon]|nr:DUF362 domain-containing protein [Candidatus Bathyarchaeota archaeon]
MLLKTSISKHHNSSKIFALEGTYGTYEDFKKFINFMGKNNLKFYKTLVKGDAFSVNGLISSDDVIILKVNSQWDERGGTNTDLVKSIINSIIEHPNGFTGEIIIADNGQAQYGSTRRGGSFDYENNNSIDKTQSINKIVNTFKNKTKISSYLWDKITENNVGEYSDGNDEDGYVLSTKIVSSTNVLVSYPKFTSEYDTKISFKLGVWDSEKKEYDYEKIKIINIPVLKCHFIFGVTGAIKHYMGIPSDKLTAKLGYRTHMTVGKGGMGTLMANTRFPTLNILDAIHVNGKPGTGPNTTYSQAIKTGIVATSTDPVALDYWASKKILCEIAKQKYSVDISPINPDNNQIGSFGNWLKLSAIELQNAGFNVTFNEEEIEVIVTSINH